MMSLLMTGHFLQVKNITSIGRIQSLIYKSTQVIPNIVANG